MFPSKKAKPDSAHHQTALATLFKQPPRPSRAFIYDLEAEFPEIRLAEQDGPRSPCGYIPPSRRC